MLKKRRLINLIVIFTVLILLVTPFLSRYLNYSRPYYDKSYILLMWGVPFIFMMISIYLKITDKNQKLIYSVISDVYFMWAISLYTFAYNSAFYFKHFEMLFKGVTWHGSGAMFWFFVPVSIMIVISVVMTLISYKFKTDDLIRFSFLTFRIIVHFILLYGYYLLLLFQRIP